MGRMSGSSQNVDGLRQMFDAFAQRRAAVSNSPLVLTSGLAQYRRITRITVPSRSSAVPFR